MSDRHFDTDTTLEANVDRLLRRHAQDARLSESDRGRILDALLANATNAPEAQETPVPRRPHRMRWRAAWSLAAAGVAVAIAAVLLLSRAPSAIAWAEVARKLATVKSIRALEIGDGRGEERRQMSDGTPIRVFHRSRFFVSDDRVRRDLYAPRQDGARPGAETPAVTWIWRFEPGRTVSIIIDHEQGTAHVDTTDRIGAPLETTEEVDPRQPGAMHYWTKLRSMATDQARPLGRRTIAGMVLIGFETDLTRRDPERIPAGSKAQVWVDPHTGIPRRYEFVSGAARGGLEEIEWDVPLPDSLFEVPASFLAREAAKATVERTLYGTREPSPSAEGSAGPRVVTGPAVTRNHRIEYGFGARRLKPDVRLEVGAPGEPPEVTERDVTVVEMGVVQPAGKPGAGVLTGVTFKLTPEGLERFRALCRRRMFQTVVVRFDGRVMSEPNVREAGFKDLGLWVEPLGLTPEQFEARYLMSP